MNELSAISHPWNRIVPIESVFEDPESPSHIFVITELLHGAEHPLWRHTEELLEFGEQVLSVRSHLVFEMLPDESDVLRYADHRLSTLSEHLECVSITFGLLCSLLIRNIWCSIALSLTWGALKMKTSNMFPKGFHPIRQTHLLDNSDVAPYHPYHECNVKYYINHLRYAKRGLDFNDPLGPQHDITCFAYIVWAFLTEVCH